MGRLINFFSQETDRWRLQCVDGWRAWTAVTYWWDISTWERRTGRCCHGQRVSDKWLEWAWRLDDRSIYETLLQASARPRDRPTPPSASSASSSPSPSTVAAAFINQTSSFSTISLDAGQCRLECFRTASCVRTFSQTRENLRHLPRRFSDVNCQSPGFYVNFILADFTPAWKNTAKYSTASARQSSYSLRRSFEQLRKLSSWKLTNFMKSCVICTHLKSGDTFKMLV